MTQDEIIEMARQVGFFIDDGQLCIDSSQEIFTSVQKELEAFAKLVAAKEREENAQIAETAADYLQNSTFEGLAKAIRARGEV